MKKINIFSLLPPEYAPVCQIFYFLLTPSFTYEIFIVYDDIYYNLCYIAFEFVNLVKPKEITKQYCNFFGKAAKKEVF